jgi:RHS repeat-associated protein
MIQHRRISGYDAAGNALSYEDVVLTYDNRNRLVSTQKGATTRTYVYNALGQLTKASGGVGGTVHYVHDESGRLVGEYDGTGGLLQETVWLGDLPVATLRPGTPIEINYVHSDHLGTPVRVTRASDDARRWQWNRDPFGTLPANENPDSIGSFSYSLRLPGQLFDGQAGLHQNMFRDYSPAIGRYVESDPIGLAGGVNTYGYVGQRPTALKDPTGLAAPAAAGLCFVPGVGWVGCGVAAVGTGAVVCFATGVCQKAIRAASSAAGVAVKAIKNFCTSEDDNPDCEEWLDVLNQNFARLAFIESRGGNIEAEKLQHNSSVDTFCSSCPGECSRASRFKPRTLQ